jgi:hypothetical protein
MEDGWMSPDRDNAIGVMVAASVKFPDGIKFWQIHIRKL